MLLHDSATGIIMMMMMLMMVMSVCDEKSSIYIYINYNKYFKTIE